MRLEMRIMAPEEAGAVTSLIRRTLREVNGRDYGPEGLGWILDYYTQDKVLEIAGAGRLYVALWEGALAGCGGLRIQGRECVLSTVFVLPEYNGRGVGRALVETLERDAVALATERITLNASITAHRFYARLGYGYRGGTPILCENDHYPMVKVLKRGIE